MTDDYPTIAPENVPEKANALQCGAVVGEDGEQIGVLPEDVHEITESD